MITKAGFPLTQVTFVNTIACTPFTSKARNALRPPTLDEIKACNARLSEYISLFPRKAIVAVGKEAEKALKLLKLEYHSIPHPAFILRQSDSKAEVVMKRTVLFLQRLRDGNPAESC